MSYLNDFKSILINVGYDEFLESNQKIKYPKYLLSNYNLEPEWVSVKDPAKGGDVNDYVKLTTLENLLDNSLANFFSSDVKFFVENKKEFLYPIILYNNRLFYEIENLEISEDLKIGLEKNLAKIVIVYLTEGFFGETPRCFEWIENFMKKYGVVKDQLIVITANFLAKDLYVNDNFKIINFSFTSNKIPFLPLNKLNKFFLSEYENAFIKKIYNNKNNLKKNHFLCFNGYPKIHRLLMFGELQTNLNLKNKSITSLRGDEKNPKNHFYNELVNYFTNYKNLDEIKKYLDFYQKYDSNISYSYDESFWKQRSDKSAGLLNYAAHSDSFLNIVTETLHQKNIVFITEKTFKPIFSCQPFIIYGNCYTLKKLKDIGFKTFDTWWDESYDNEPDLFKRLNKISEVLETISSWDFEYCRKVLIEMENVLVDNYNRLLDSKDLLELYQVLKCENKTINKNII